MHRLRGRTIFRFFGAVLFAAVAIEMLVLFSPEIDERLDYLTHRSLSLVQGFQTNGITVRDVVNQHYHNARWTAFHRDYLTETYVRCDAMDATGAPIALMWVVTWHFAVHRLRPVFQPSATAHNYAAFEVAPALYETGHTLYKSPDFANW